MALALGQFSYNGLTMGPGTPFQWNTVDGLTGLPNIRVGDVPRPNANSMLGGYDFTGTRTVTFNLEITSGAGNTMQQNLNLARAAFQPSQALSGGVSLPGPVLSYNFNEGQVRDLTCRVEKFDSTVDIGWAGGNYTAGIATASVQLTSVDSTLYDDTMQSGTMSVSAGGAGWVFPWTFPWVFQAESTGNTVFAANTGNTMVYPVFTFSGGYFYGPVIQNLTAGTQFAFNLTMGPTDTLVVDTWGGSAILNGTASRISTLVPGSLFSGIPGGSVVQWGLRALSSATGTANISWRNGWN